MPKHQGVKQQKDLEDSREWTHDTAKEKEQATNLPRSCHTHCAEAVFVTAKAVLLAPLHPLPQQIRNETKTTVKSIY